MWAAGFGGTQTTDGNAVVGSDNTTSRIYGGAAGADYRLSPDMLAGFALAGGGTNFTVANGLGSGRSDLFQAGAFVRHNVGAAYLSGALAYGWQDVTTDRTVTVAGIDQLRALQRQCLVGPRRRRLPLRHAGMALHALRRGTVHHFELPAYAESVVVRRQHLCAELRREDRHGLAQRTRLAHRQIVRDAGRHPDAARPRRLGARFQHRPHHRRDVPDAAGREFCRQRRGAGARRRAGHASAEMKWLNGFSLGATFEGEFSNVTRSYAGKGVVRYAW